MSYEVGDDFAELVAQEVAAAGEAAANRTPTEEGLWWEEAVRASKGYAEQSWRLESERRQRVAARTAPIMELGKVFARTLTRSGVDFDVQYPPSMKSIRQRERRGLPAERAAWAVTEQTYHYKSFTAHDTYRGETVEYSFEAEGDNYRGIAVASDGRFMTYGDLQEDLRPWRTVDPRVRRTMLLTRIATPSELVTAPGLPLLERSQSPVAPARELDDIDRVFLLPPESEVAPIDNLYESWKTHLVGVASRIIVAHQSG